MAEDQWEIRRRFSSPFVGREPLHDPVKIARARKAIDVEYRRMKEERAKGTVAPCNPAS